MHRNKKREQSYIANFVPFQNLNLIFLSQYVFIFNNSPKICTFIVDMLVDNACLYAV